MRKKSIKTDRHINVEDEFSDYDSSASNSEIDVKEALRSSISLKTKYQRNVNLQLGRSTSGSGFEFSMQHNPRHEDELSTISSDSMDVGLNTIALPKKDRKNKKPEDQETAAMRRERNRLAAQRCRQRRRDRIDKLEKICEKLENDGHKLETEITDLQNEMNHLQKILTNHKCMAASRGKADYNYNKYDNRIISS